jgi:hypothetical protein
MVKNWQCKDKYSRVIHVRFEAAGSEELRLDFEDFILHEDKLSNIKKER